MTTSHKNKNCVTFLASAFGSLDLHRFYLAGVKDKWGWLHLISLPLSLLTYLFLGQDQLVPFLFAPLVISGLVACIESLVIGLTSDEKWDAKYNAHSGKQSNSSWVCHIPGGTDTGRRYDCTDWRHRAHVRPAIHRRRLR